MTGTSAPQPVRGNQTAWQSLVSRFRKHRPAVWALYALALLYAVAALAEFVAPVTREWRSLDHAYSPPQSVGWSWSQGLHAERLVRHVDEVTLASTYHRDPDRVVPIGFLVPGEPYRLLGLIPCSTHLFGVDRQRWQARPTEADGIVEPEPAFYLLGADKYGRDLFSRCVYGARISLSVGLVGIACAFFLGVSIGGISGYLGGRWDEFIQRSIEVINSFPHLPLWMALAAVLPADWSALQTYFAITVVLGLLGWTGLARTVRSKILSLREEDYVTAARLQGASHTRIIFRHLVPGFSSHIIVALTLAVPGMILGETALSFLGLGLRPPIVSWGVMLQGCMDFTAVANYPWLLLPVLPIVLTVLCCNILGDGLRDAADPNAGRA